MLLSLHGVYKCTCTHNLKNKSRKREVHIKLYYAKIPRNVKRSEVFSASAVKCVCVCTCKAFLTKHAVREIIFSNLLLICAN